MLGFFQRRTGDPEAAADLTAETFAAALAARGRFQATSDARGGLAVRDRPAQAGRLPPDQRDAVRAHVLDERSYGEIAGSLASSEATVRKRISRGLHALRGRAGDER